MPISFCRAARAVEGAKHSKKLPKKTCVDDQDILASLLQDTKLRIASLKRRLGSPSPTLDQATLRALISAEELFLHALTEHQHDINEMVPALDSSLSKLMAMRDNRKDPSLTFPGLVRDVADYSRQLYLLFKHLKGLQELPRSEMATLSCYFHIRADLEKIDRAIQPPVSSRRVYSTGAAGASHAAVRIRRRSRLQRDAGGDNAGPGVPTRTLLPK
tara:strand:+ start:346 stop:993 length:648 start_codon:yes stop_codon:yes gene_type:complete